MANRSDRWKRRALFALFFMLLVLPELAGCTSGVSALGEPPAASDLNVDPWPRQLASGDNTFSLFQPQYESWDQGRLSGRAAVAARQQATPDPISDAVFCFTPTPSPPPAPPPHPDTESKHMKTQLRPHSQPRSLLVTTM